MSQDRAFGCLTGRVVRAEDGQPVPQASIRLLGGLTARPCRLTGADGVFRYNLVSAGQHQLEVIAPERTGRQVLVHILPGQVHETSVVLAAAGTESNPDDPVSLTVSGQILLCAPAGPAPLGRPASLFIYSPDSGEMAGTFPVTGSPYTVTARVTPGAYAIQVEDVPGYRTTLQMVNVPSAPRAALTVNFHLLRGDPNAPPAEDPGRCPQG